MKIIKLSKFIYTMTALILCLCMFCNPSFASASTSSSLNYVKSENDVNISSTTSRYVTVNGRYTGLKENIPDTYYYNEDGYRGTLLLTRKLLDSYASPVPLWHLTYEGWVNCTGVCHAPASIDEEL